MPPRRPARAVTAPRKNALSQDLLGTLAERVRAGRKRLALTRRALADVSGVSERHLAQLESGAGNISVMLLGKVAEALQVPVAELLREASARTAEIELINDLLSELPETALAQLRQQLSTTYGKAVERRRDRIALIGLRGGGKSTLGAWLAKHLQVPFIELDREIEREAGTSLNEVFMLYGQAGFRRYEKRCLDRILHQHQRAVIATGGSIVSEPATFDLLLASCMTVWIKAAPEEHMARVVAQGDLRPMQGNAQSMTDLRRILDARDSLYRRADAIVDTRGRSAERSLRDLIKVTQI